MAPTSDDDEGVEGRTFDSSHILDYPGPDHMWSSDRCLFEHHYHASPAESLARRPSSAALLISSLLQLYDLQDETYP